MNSGYSENNFAQVFQRDFESLFVVVIINFWLLQMASSRRTYTAAEAARHILEGDGCKLDRIDADLEIEVCVRVETQLYSGDVQLYINISVAYFISVYR